MAALWSMARSGELMIFVWRRWLMATESRIVRAGWVLKKHSLPVKLTFVAFRTPVTLFLQNRFTFCDRLLVVPTNMFDYCFPIRKPVMRDLKRPYDMSGQFKDIPTLIRNISSMSHILKLVIEWVLTDKYVLSNFLVNILYIHMTY